MSHNKMYRYIEGYEKATYLCSDAIDELDELNEHLSYGESYLEALERVAKIEKIISKMKSHIEDGKGKKITD